MWIPKTAQEVENAARANDLPETPSFDAKAELPVRKKNVSLAIDVAAMTTDGGVLLYGVAEDDEGQPTVPAPIELAGAGQRIDQIVSTSISEVPFVEARELPLDGDPARGYIALVVPQSERAPHQVIVGQEFRFYGRGPKGNRILTEGEVAQLYRRREEWSQNRLAVLETVIQSSGIPAQSGQGYLHAFTRPTVSDPELFERAIEALGGVQRVHQALLGIASQTQLGGTFAPDVGRASYWEHQSADEWRLATRGADERLEGDVTNLAEVGINLDGRGQLFCGRATDVRLAQSEPMIIEAVIAGNAETFFAIMGAIYEAAGYHGHVDVGLAITGVEGANSYVRSQNWQLSPLRYSADRFTRVAGISAAELQDAPALAHRMLRHFYVASTGYLNYNPFEKDA
jgi:hypothetical protein